MPSPHRMYAFMVALAVSIPAAASTDPSLLTPEQMRADLTVARTALEESHPGVYRYETPSEFAAAFDAAARRCERPMDVRAFCREVSTAVASIRCAHTGVGLPDTLQREIDAVPILPLSVRIIGGRVFVLRDLSGGTPSLVGRELLAVAGVPVARVLDTLYAASPRDGDAETSLAWRHGGLRFGVGLVRLLGLRSPYAVELRAARGGPERVMLPGIPRPALLDTLRARYPQDNPPATAFELGFLDGGAVATMALHRFTAAQDSATQAALHHTVPAAFDSLRARRSRALILDLRGNGGGEDELGLALLSELIDHSFTYYDSLVVDARRFSIMPYVVSLDSIPPGFAKPKPDGRLGVVGHPNLGTHAPASSHFDGPLFVLVDGRSLSTTCEFLSNLTARRRATLIGEESGGAYCGNTSGFSMLVRLPNSGIQVAIPQMTYYLAAHAAPPRRGILATVPVQWTIDDWVAGRDPVMARALALARRAAR